MSHIPEEFHWDGVVFYLKCEIDHLINALMPLPIKKVEELISSFQVFPAILEQNLSYKKRLDLEKKLEHLPVKVFWCPTSKYTLHHFQNAVIKLNLEKSLFPLSVNENFNREELLKEILEFENLYSISDFTVAYKDENYLQGLTKALEKQSIFNREELLRFMECVKSRWEVIWQNAIHPNLSIVASQIAYFSSEDRIEIAKDQQVNLVQPNGLTEDFHLILPDFLVRGFYCKLIQSSRQEISKRMNPEIYQQNIFSMAELMYIVCNNWVKLKELPDIFLLNYEPKILNNHSQDLYIKNHASGVGFLIHWKLEMNGLPQHKFSMLFTLEAISQLQSLP